MTEEQLSDLIDRGFDGGFVVLGAIVAAVVQWLFLLQESGKRREALAFSIFHKVEIYHSTIVHLCSHILLCRQHKVGKSFWQDLSPFPSVRDDVAEFSPEELQIFSGSKDLEYAHALMNFCNLHNVMLLHMRMYADARLELERSIQSATNIETEGELASYDVRILSKFPLSEGKVESLARNLLRYAEEGKPAAASIMATIQERLCRHVRQFRVERLPDVAPAPSISTARK